MSKNFTRTLLLFIVLLSTTLCFGQAGTSTPTGNMNIGRAYFTATVLQNGKVLVAGGETNSNILASAELYDPVTGVWTPVGNMPAPRTSHTATLLSDGKVLIAGGYGAGYTYVTSSFLYDPITGVWATVGDLQVTRIFHTATLLPNGKVLVAGGLDIYGVNSGLSSVELYDPSTKMWSLAGGIYIGRYKHTATLLPDGNIVLAGGVGDAASTSEFFDPVAGSSISISYLNFGRYSFTASLLPDGRVLICGGGDINSGDAMASSELYDPSTDQWTQTGDMSSARMEHTDAVLADGRILVTGGRNYQYVLQSEIYNPLTGTWGSAGTMSTPRTFHTSTLLPNGKVLIAGGQSSGEILSSSELYGGISGNPVICVDGTTQLTVTESGGVWSSNTPSVATISTGGLVSGVNAGTSTISYTFINQLGVYTTYTQLITVNEKLIPTFAQIGAICPGAALPALPTISLNNIKGTWSPALNNTSTTTYIFTPDAGQCAKIATMTIEVNSLTPTFSQVGTICSGASLAALPTLSENGIHGTWMPALNNITTTTYTFTPDAGQCATTTTMTIPVIAVITPTFTQVAPICSGGSLTALPTKSNNGVKGTWSPVLDNTATTTYTFTPDAGQCATTATMIITVTPAITPAFTQVGPICNGEILPRLPSISNDGIRGRWSPSLDNRRTTTYTFVPDAGQCAATATMTITVNPPVIPTFTQIEAVCSGSSFDLPTTSNNGITGTWSPEINNTATTTYTFTPDAGLCAATTTMTVTVNEIPAAIIITNGPTTVCAPNTVTLTSGSATGNVWSTGETTQSITISTENYADNYTVTVTQNGCSATSEPVFVAIDALPVLPAVHLPVNICTGTPKASVYHGGNDPGGEWTSSDPSIVSVTVRERTRGGNVQGPPTGDYIVTLQGMATGTAVITFSKSNGECSASQSFTVTVNDPPQATITASGNTSICPGGSVTLHASEGTSYYWSNGETTQDITVTQAGDYTVEVTSEAGCAVTSLPVSVVVNEITEAAPIAGLTDLCTGTTVQLENANMGGVWGSGDHTIATIDANGVVTGISAGSVLITYTGACGITSSVTVYVSATVTPVFTQVAPVFYGTVIDPLPATSNNGITGTWSPALDNTVTTTYTFTPDEGQCATTVTMTIVMVDDNEPPVVACHENIIQLNDPGVAGAIVHYGVANFNTDSLYAIWGGLLRKFNGNDGSIVSDVPVTVSGLTGDLTVQSIALDPTSGQVYIGLVVDFDFSNVLLATVDLSSGIAKVIGNTTHGIAAMAFDQNGRLFGMADANTDVCPDCLYEIDKHTAQATGVMNFINPGGTAMAFNFDDHMLYVGNNNIFSKIDVNTFTETIVNSNVNLRSIGGNNIGHIIYIGNGKFYVTDQRDGNFGIIDVNGIGIQGFPNLSFPHTQGFLLAGFAPVAASDNSGHYTITQTGGLPAGSLFPIGTTINTFEIRDLFNNVSHCSFTVTINNSCEPAVFTSRPADITQATDANSCTAVVAYEIQTTGNPAPELSYSLSGATTGSGTGTGSGLAFNKGITKVTITATNGCSSVNCMFTVTINDDQPPVISCSPNITATATSAAGAVVTYPIPVATDNCSVAAVTLTNGLPRGSTFQIGTTTVTYTATDVDGLTASCSFDVIVSGSAPVINCPGNILVSSTAGLCGAIVNFAATETTAMPASTITYSVAPGSFLPVGTTTVTATATNAVGVSVCSFTVTVIDNQFPVLTGVPANVTVECNAVPAAATVTATDNCVTSVPSFTETRTDGSCSGNYTLTRTWSTTDASNNTTTATQVITVQDTQKPVLSAAPANVTVECNAVPPAAALTATDNCSTPVITYTEVRTNGSSPYNYTVTRTWTATDACGNNCTKTQVITVRDTQAPIPTIAALATLTGDCLVVATAPTATDNCAGIITATTLNPTSYTAQGVYTITWNYSDGNGNTSSQTQRVVVKDVTPPMPTLTGLPNISGQCSVTVTTKPTAADACSGVTVQGTTTDPLTYTVQGTYTIHWTYTDNLGNKSYQNQTVIVQDNIAPVPNTASLPVIEGQCLVNITMISSTRCTDNCFCCRMVCHCRTSDCNCRSWSEWIYSILSYFLGGAFDNNHGCDHDDDVDDVNNMKMQAPTATDNCKGTIIGTTTDPLTYNTQGTHTIHWKFDDGNGNTVIQNQTVIIKDDTKPKLTEPNDITISCGSSTLPAATGNATATDNCGAVTISYNDVVSGNKITRTWKATDAAGNFDTDTQIITIIDNTKPTITDINDVTVNCGASTLPGATGTPMAIDACSTPTVTYTDVVNGNRITRTWKATDAAGNYNTSTQVITVGAVFTATISSVPNSSVYTGAVATNLYLGYGAQSTVLQVSSLPSSGAPYTYVWSSSYNNRLNSTTSSAPLFTPVASGYHTFTVTVTNKYGCSSTGVISICVTDIRVPGSNGKVYICHAPPGSPHNKQTLSVSVNAVDAHLENHSSDRLGSCDQSTCSGPVVNSITEAKPATTLAGTGEKDAVTSEEELKVTVMPNPTTTFFTLKLESKYETPVNMRVMDGRGRVVDAKSKIGANSTIQIGHNYSSGTYYAELIQGNKRKVVQLVKGKG